MKSNVGICLDRSFRIFVDFLLPFLLDVGLILLLICVCVCVCVLFLLFLLTQYCRSNDLYELPNIIENVGMYLFI